MRIALYAGTFDPLTLGHVDVIRRAAALFDAVVVGVGHNPAKTRLLPLDVRMAVIRESLADLPSVRVESYEGLTVHFAERVGACAIIRGLRDAVDLGFEFPQAHANHRMAPAVDTVFLPTDPALSFVSSSLMREIASAGGDPSPWLPAAAWAALRSRFGRPLPTK